MVEIVVAELKEFNKEAKSDYLKKKATVAAQLKIDVDDIPKDWKWE